jgi:hypothetical protein
VAPKDSYDQRLRRAHRIQANIVIGLGVLTILVNFHRHGVLMWPESFDWRLLILIAIAASGIVMGVRMLRHKHAAVPQLPMSAPAWRFFVALLGMGAILFGTMAAETPSPAMILGAVMWTVFFLFFLIARRPRQTTRKKNNHQRPYTRRDELSRVGDLRQDHGPDHREAGEEAV